MNCFLRFWFVSLCLIKFLTLLLKPSKSFCISVRTFLRESKIAIEFNKFPILSSVKRSFKRLSLYLFKQALVSTLIWFLLDVISFSSSINFEIWELIVEFLIVSSFNNVVISSNLEDKFSFSVVFLLNSLL